MNRLLISLILCVFCINVTAEEDYLCIMSYNVENLFDTLHDAGKNDMDFMPQGNHRWSRARFFRKLQEISKVIVAVDSVKPCEIVGLCEVENDTVLTYLTQRTPLHRLGYRYVMTESADERGIDIALLYSPLRFHLLTHESIRADTTTPTRDVLYVSGTTPEGDTLDIYLLHLPSKLGGNTAARNRTSVITTILNHSDSVTQVRTHTNLILMGDFNDELKGRQMQPFRDHGFTDIIADTKPGTYKYRGTWQTIDHMLVKSTPVRPIEGGITSLPFLLEPDKTHGGTKPHRTYLGPTYHKGISDHLPVWCKLYLGHKE